MNDPIEFETWVNLAVLCECGHKLKDHHGAMSCLTDDFPVDTNKYCAENRDDFPHAHGEECEYWGFNEMGGLKPIGKDGLVLYWIKDESETRWTALILNDKVDHWDNHCQKFVLLTR